MGDKRSVIVDLNREEFKFIPNSLAELLVSNIGITKEKIIEAFGKVNEETLNQYFNFLEKHEYIFWCDEDELALFPELDLNWKSPSIATNAIFDINTFSKIDFEVMISQLNEMNCQNIQIRAYTFQNLAYWEKVLIFSINSRIRSIEIITPWSELIEINEILNLIKKNDRIRSIVFYSAPFFKTINLDSNMGLIAFIQENIISELHCGQIHSNYFNTNLKLFTEAQKHNTCLNRKISIDVNGEIKNCPSMAKSYGNIKDTTLAEAIEKPGFKDMWFINKDQIDVCKDCEFRYICTDCRAYIENPEDIYSKPLKCGYNPYTAEWEEWSTNPLKQKAIEYYGMQELVKNDK